MNVVGIPPLSQNPNARTAVQITSSAVSATTQGDSATAGTPVAPGPTVNGTGQTGSVGKSSSMDPADVHKNVARLNELLASTNTKIEVDSRAPVNDIWLNLVDKTTGEVLQRFPPEGLREFALSQQPKGLALDTQG